MQQKSKTITVVNAGVLILGVLLLLYSAWNLFIKSTYVPYLLLFTGSILVIAMFTALTIARYKGKVAAAWTGLALLNSLLIVCLYIKPQHLKELYPLSIWIFLTILIASIQQVLDRMKKRYHSVIRIANLGLIVTLIPVYILKSDTPIIWTIFSWLTLILMLVNLVLFLLPASRQHQSR